MLSGPQMSWIALRRIRATPNEEIRRITGAVRLRRRNSAWSMPTAAAAVPASASGKATYIGSASGPTPTRAR